MNNYFLFLEHRTFLVLHSFFLISGKKKRASQEFYYLFWTVQDWIGHLWLFHFVKMLFYKQTKVNLN